MKFWGYDMGYQSQAQTLGLDEAQLAYMKPFIKSFC